jgi:hypothetical protein
MGSIPVLLLGIVKSLVTEALFKRVVLIALKALVKSTKNTLDDELVKPVADALGLKP